MGTRAIHILYNLHIFAVLDSERDDRSIDFTMGVFFFFFYLTFWGSKNASIFKFDVFSSRKLSLVGTLKDRKKKFPAFSITIGEYLEFFSNVYIKIIPCTYFI